MIVVSNTSPITNLAAIGHLPLLQKLYGRIMIADAVWQELNAFGRAWPGSREAASSDWITIKPVKQQTVVTALLSDIDRGEAETIALALEQGAALVILDEREGRRQAQRFGLDVIGVLGILIDAKDQGYVDAIAPLVSALKQRAGFYMSDAVVARALHLAGE